MLEFAIIKKSKAPIKVIDLETGETYNSLNEAGFKLGYLTAVKVPARAYEEGEEFVLRGHRLRLLL